MSNASPQQHGLFSFQIGNIDPALMDTDYEAQAADQDEEAPMNSFLDDEPRSPTWLTDDRSSRQQPQYMSSGLQELRMQDTDSMNVGEDVEGAIDDANEQPIERGRAASSLISDNSDGQPYIPSPSPDSDAGPSGKKKRTSFLSVSPQPDLGRGKSAAPKHGPTRRPNATNAIKRAATVAPVTFANKTPFSMMVPDFNITSGDPTTAEPFPFPEPETEVLPNAKASRQKRKRGATVAPIERAQSHLDDPRASMPISDDIPVEGERSEFSHAYQKLVKGHQAQLVILDTMHTEHEKAMKKTQNLASRRKTRIEYVLPIHNL